MARWQQPGWERALVGVGCFVLGMVSSEEYRRWGRRRLLDAFGLGELI